MVCGASIEGHQMDLITMHHNLTAVQYIQQVLHPHILLFFQQHVPALTYMHDCTVLPLPPSCPADTGIPA